MLENQVIPAGKIIRDPQISGFWRRLVALMIDLILMWLTTLVLIFITLKIHPPTIRYASYIGFMIALVYYGIMNSKICRGQTIGKKMLEIQVVNRDGNYLGLGRSFFRAAVLSALVCIQSFGALTWLVFVYMYIFNRKTRQSLHDVFASTFVIGAETKGPLVSRTWKIHYLVASILFVLSFLPVIAAFKAGAHPGDPSLQHMQTEIKKMETVKEVRVQFGEQGLLNDPKKKKYMAVGVILTQPPAPKMEDKVAKIILEKYPPAQNYDLIGVQLITVNGISGFYRNYSFSPVVWRHEIDQMRLIE